MIRDYTLLMRAPQQLSLEFFELCIELLELIRLMGGGVWQSGPRTGGMLWDFGFYQQFDEVRERLDALIQGRAAWALTSENRAVYQGFTADEAAIWRRSFEEAS